MFNRLQGWIARLLRVPPEPDPPSGAPGSVRLFRAGAGYLQYRLLFWFGRQASVLLGILFVLVFPIWDFTFVYGAVDVALGLVTDKLSRVLPWNPFGSYSIVDIIRTIELLALGAFLLQLPFTLALVLLDYEYRWYIITDRSLRIREGLTRVEERTLTFSNIQHISVRQGPLQRWFGISDLEVRTAGGSDGGSGESEQDSGDKNLHRASFRGISNAQEVYEAIRLHLKDQSESGLGDLDETHAKKTPARKPEPSRLLLSAARKVREEVRALRAAIE